MTMLVLTARDNNTVSFCFIYFADIVRTVLFSFMRFSVIVKYLAIKCSSESLIISCLGAFERNAFLTYDAGRTLSQFPSSQEKLSWSQRFFLIFPLANEEKEKPPVTLDLNLTFMQTPAVK